MDVRYVCLHGDRFVVFVVHIFSLKMVLLILNNFAPKEPTHSLIYCRHLIEFLRLFPLILRNHPLNCHNSLTKYQPRLMSSPFHIFVTSPSHVIAFSNICPFDLWFFCWFLLNSPYLIEAFEGAKYLFEKWYFFFIFFFLTMHGFRPFGGLIHGVWTHSHTGSNQLKLSLFRFYVNISLCKYLRNRWLGHFWSLCVKENF